jgi:hypothetical protein
MLAQRRFHRSTLAFAQRWRRLSRGNSDRWLTREQIGGPQRFLPGIGEQPCTLDRLSQGAHSVRPAGAPDRLARRVRLHVAAGPPSGLAEQAEEVAGQKDRILPARRQRNLDQPKRGGKEGLLLAVVQANVTIESKRPRSFSGRSFGGPRRQAGCSGAGRCWKGSWVRL